MKRAPVRVKVAGVLLVLIGLFTAMGPLLQAMGMTEAGATVVTGAVVCAAGLGLLFDRPWAWSVALALSGAGVAFGIISMTQPPDLAAIGAPQVSLFALVIPGALLAIVLLTSRPSRWRRQPDPPRHG